MLRQRGHAVGDLSWGRSRGGLTTKPHLAVEQGQKPLSLLVTAGHRHDSPQFQPVLEGIRVPRIGPGRPRTKPDKVRADRAYGSRANRAYLRTTAKCRTAGNQWHEMAHQACQRAASCRVASRDGMARSSVSRSQAVTPVWEVSRDCRDAARMMRLALGLRSAS